MSNLPRPLTILFTTCIVGMAACIQQNEMVPTTHVDVSEEKPDTIDHYLEIDKRALLGVNKKDAKQALAGDGAIAVAIGNAFADANRVAEAHFWYQISAENGNAIGMRNFSILMRDFDCHRANYWLRKALDADGIGRKGKASIKKSLREYMASCR